MGGYRLIRGVFWAMAMGMGTVHTGCNASPAQQHPEEDRVAQFNRGIEYYEGRCPGDLTEEARFDRAYAHFQSAADQGSAPALYNLAQMCSRGQGPAKGWDKTQRQDRAFDFLTRASEQQDGASQSNLGVMYIKQKGPARDMPIQVCGQRAFDLFQASADRGYPPAHINLALAYLIGIGAAGQKTAEERLHRAREFLGLSGGWAYVQQNPPLEREVRNALIRLIAEVLQEQKRTE